MARFGYNKYALVLGMLTLGGISAGCGGGGGGGGGFAASAVNSGSNAAPTTSSVLTNGPRLETAKFVDVDNNQMISKGDQVVLAFNGELAPITTSLDPAKEFELAVQGDSFGKNASIVAVGTNSCAVVLGDAPALHVSDPFSIGKTTAGSASGVNVSIFASGKLLGRDAGPVAAAASPVDLDGTLASGFRPAPSLQLPRGAHSAVELDDGRVLVIGGVAANGGKKAGDFLADAELFDPVTNTWTLVSDLTGTTKGRMMNGKVAVKTAQGSAVKLQDGTVLICGGFGVEKKGLFGLGGEKVDTLESAYLFNPTTNEFEKVGNMKYPRHSHTATLMSDGRVLIAGGYNDSWWSKDKTQAPFEIYDPAKKAFDAPGSIFSKFKSKEGRMNHTATLIESGQGILLAGGNHYEGGYLFGLIKPKLKTNTGSEVVRGQVTEKAGDLVAKRINHSAALVGPRNVLLAGGHEASAAVGQLELYDTATASWTAAGSLATARTGCEIAVDKNLAMIMGGYDGTKEVASCEVFDADAKQLSQASFTMATARNGFTVSKLKDGRFLVVGGLTGATKSFDGLDGQALDSCEVFVRQ